MQLFYTPDLSDHIILENDDHRHCSKVLRKRVGDQIIATDGKGLKIIGSIIDIDKRQTKVKIEERVEMAKPAWKLSIAIAPTKNNARFEWFLEKATEIGVHEILPFVSKHSERKNLKMERCQKILVAAMKQSNQFYLPKLHQLSTFDEVVRLQSNGDKYIAYVEENEQHLKSHYKKDSNVLIFIGPEGGFNKDEITLALSQHTTKVSLGTNRLRTETAGVVATQIINGINH